MTDKEIIALYFKRSENAIEQTDVKYGRLCHSISINILNDTRDSEECVSDGTEASDNVEFEELQKAINTFLSELPEKKRILFLRRYWFMQPVKEIAKDYGITEKTASMRLSRLREKLQQYLQEKELI